MEQDLDPIGKQIEKLSLATVKVIKHEGYKPAVLVPNDFGLRELEQDLEFPELLQQNIHVDDVQSFIEYWKKHKTDESVIFCRDNAFTAIIDYHTKANDPRWLKHQTSFPCKFSDEFDIWNQHNRKRMSQLDFAYFLEDCVDDIVGASAADEKIQIPKEAPSGTDMLQLATNFKASKKADFLSDHILQNGQCELKYKETVNGQDSQGMVKVPEFFYLGIPIFLNGDRYKLTCRLKYRIEEGRLYMWYEIVRKERVLRSAFNDIKEHITKECGTFVFEGAVKA